jgi:hypothetical protein
MPIILERYNQEPENGGSHAAIDKDIFSDWG